jgi:hypothetical protein
MADSALAPAVPIPNPGPSGGIRREDDRDVSSVPLGTESPTPAPPRVPPPRTLEPEDSLNACSPDNLLKIAVLSISNVHRHDLAEGTLTETRLGEREKDDESTSPPLHRPSPQSKTHLTAPRARSSKLGYLNELPLGSGPRSNRPTY